MAEIVKSSALVHQLIALWVRELPPVYASTHLDLRIFIYFYSFAL